MDTTCLKKPSRSTGKRVSRKSFETQTLTQAGFVFYQSPVDEDMVYDEEPNAARYSPSNSRKRWRNELEEPVTSRTRSAKKRAAEHIVKSEDAKSEDDVEKKDGLKLILGPTLRQTVATVSMPPPKTPQPTRRREVPSSQSPADTPLSTLSRRSRDMLRSPLKAKSVNIRRRIISPRGEKIWARMGEAADSLECEDEDEEKPQVLSLSSTSAIAINLEPWNDTRSLVGSQVEDLPGARPEETISSRGGPCPKRKPRNFKLEISDSDNDIDESDEEDFDLGSGSQIDVSGRNPETGSSTQIAAGSSTGSNISESGETPKQEARISKKANTPPTAESELEQGPTTPRPTRSAQTRAASRTWLPLTIDYQSPLYHNRYRLPADSPSKPYRPSISSPISIPLPLINNLSPQTPPDAPRGAPPETESQLQNAWRDFSPIVNAGLNPNFPVTQPSLPMYPVGVQQQQQQQQLAPIPPSQATTVDITQRSPPLAPAPPPLSSSPQLHAPVINNDSDDDDPPEEPDTLARDIGGWEAVRLTDSQLRFDSLIDDTTLPAPPISLLSSSPAPSRYDGR